MRTTTLLLGVIITGGILLFANMAALDHHVDGVVHWEENLTILGIYLTVTVVCTAILLKTSRRAGQKK